jgi:uncharacterized phage protein gp47/JayE
MSTIDLLGQNGLQVKDLPTLISDISADMKNIYGSDIIITPNSPDGQRININAQAGVDIRELLTDIYTGIDPNQASGVVLDQRIAINNIQRIGGSYTVQPIAITCSAGCTLQGLDANYNSPLGIEYTIQDNSGNKYILINSVTLGAGTTTVNFRAATIGAVTPAINTITIPVTIVLGVTSVINSSGVLSTGITQETDANVKIRRIQSLSNASFAYINGLLGYVLSLKGVVAAKLYENHTNVTDSNGIPANCIWLIVSGGSSADIANAIYVKKTPGTNMKGTQTYNISTVNSGVFVAQWDVPSALPLYIKFNIQTTIVGSSFNQTAIKAYIASNLSYNIGDYSDISHVSNVALAAINANGGGGVPTGVKISTDGINWYDYLTVSTLNQQFTLSASNMTITII